MKTSVLKFAARALISLALIAVLYRRVDLGALGARLTALRWTPLLAFFAILFFNTFLSAVKWWLFLRADGIKVPLAKVYLSYFVAGFFTVLLPSTIGGDTYRVYDLSRAARTGHVVASVFADRLTGFLALAVLGLAFALAGHSLLPNRALVWIPLSVFVALLAAAWSLYQQRLLRFGLRITRLDRLPPLARFAVGIRTKAAPGGELVVLQVSVGRDPHRHPAAIAEGRG